MQKKRIHLILLLITKHFEFAFSGDNSYLFVNGKEVTKFKAKILS